MPPAARDWTADLGAAGCPAPLVASVVDLLARAEPYGYPPSLRVVAGEDFDTAALLILAARRHLRHAGWRVEVRPRARWILLLPA